MELGLNGKGVIVTGGSRGVGFSTAEAFGRGGGNGSVCARSEGPLETARKGLAAHGGPRLLYPSPRPRDRTRYRMPSSA